MSKLISGPKVYLRQPLIDDAKLWAIWLNDYQIALPLGDEIYAKITEEGLKKQIEDYPKSEYYMFTIVTNDNDKAIGRCILFNIDQVNRKGTVGIFLGDRSSWGKGYAKEAFELLIEYSFRIINLHSIMLGVFEFNQRAISMYKKIGFKEIGKRREVRKLNGIYVDVLLMDLLESEYINKYLDFSIIE